MSDSTQAGHTSVPSAFVAAYSPDEARKESVAR